MTNNIYSSSPPNLVALILNSIHLENVAVETVDAVKALGAVEDKALGRSRWIMKFDNDDMLLEKLTELNRLGFLFEGEPTGWPPAEVFDHLRKQKLINESFKEIRWRGPGNWFIIER